MKASRRGWARRVLRSVLVVASAAVLATSAYAWTQVQLLDRSTAAVSGLATPGPTGPAAAQNILLLGVDSRTDPRGYPLPPAVLAALHAGSASDGGDTADTLILVHVPAGGGRATALSIPRDSFVRIAGGYGTHKINSAYARAAAHTSDTLTAGSGASAGSPTSPFSPQAGAGASPDDPAVRRAALAAGAQTTIDTVQALTGVTITHFASVNLAGFAEISQAIGPVPVCLRAPVDDPYSGLRLDAGSQRVSGAQALAFVRQRHGLPGGDLDRIARQQMFLAGATHQLLTAGILADPLALTRLSEVISRSITLDSHWDLLSFAEQTRKLTGGAVTFTTIPTGTTDLATPEDGQAVQVDPPQVRTFVAAAFNSNAGSPPPTSPPGAATMTTPTTRSTPSGPTTSDTAPPSITAAAPGCIN